MDDSTQTTVPDANPLLQRILTDSFEEIYVFDAGTLKFIQVSHGALVNLGYSMEEMRSLTAKDIKPDLSDEAFIQLIQPLQTGEKDLLVFETRHRRKDGSVYPVEVRLQLARDITPPVFIAFILDQTASRRALLNLRESEARLSEAQRIARLGSWQLDLRSNELQWSDEIFRIFEIDPQQFGASYEAFLDAIHPDDRERVNAAYLSSLEDRLPYEIEHRLLMKDGRLKYVQERCETEFDVDGKPLRSMGTVQDISDHKRAEMVARENEQRFHILAQISPVGIFRTDAQGLCIYVNERWLDMAGMAEPESLGEGWVAAIHADDRERVFQEWSQAVRMQTSFYTEFRLQRPDAPDGGKGRITWVLAQATAERDAAGNIAGYVGTITDITQHKRIEEALSELAAAGAGEAFFQRLAQGMATLFNARKAFLCRFLPDQPEVAENLAVWSREGSDNGGKDCCKLSDSPCGRTIAHGGVFTIKEHLGERFGHDCCGLATTSRAESFIGTPLLDGEGRTIGIMGIVDDKPLEDSPALQPILEMFAARAAAELERQAAEQAIRHQRDQLEREVQQRTAELRASNQELESFAYSVSHDLRAPLRAIDGFSQALLEDYGERLDETATGYLQRVRIGTQRMGKLIDDMLQLSRVTRGEFTCQPVDLSALANSIIRQLQESSPGREVLVSVEPDRVVEGDRRLLGVLLDNLLGNAWKYTSKQDNSHIEFGSTRQDQDQGQVFFVRDNGVGFNMKYLDKVFAAFQRLHSSSEFEGSGIGLATVQRIANRHGGRVWAEAEEGKGATFYFTLGASVHHKGAEDTEDASS